MTKAWRHLQVIRTMTFLGMITYHRFYKHWLSAYYVPGSGPVARREQGCGNESNRGPLRNSQLSGRGKGRCVLFWGRRRKKHRKNFGPSDAARLSLATLWKLQVGWEGRELPQHRRGTMAFIARPERYTRNADPMKASPWAWPSAQRMQ